MRFPNMYRYIMVIVILLSMSALLHAVKPKNTGKLVTSFWGDMTVVEITKSLEQAQEQLEYSLRHVGDKFTVIDARKLGGDKGYKDFASVVTFGLIAVKYQDLFNSTKAAEYFYKDWVEYQKCERERNSGTRKGSCDTFGNGPGDYNPLASAIGQWKDAGMYNEALKHYDEYFDYALLSRPENGTRKEKLQFLKNEIKVDAELKKEYTDFMQEWARTKELAKIEKPKPLDPAVQNHEWFYSDKQDEVLKALEYYHVNKVQFMLEKALTHKDPVVAAKAKEYFESLSKVETNGKESK